MQVWVENGDQSGLCGEFFEYRLGAFSDAFSHLYKRTCPSVITSVSRSVPHELNLLEMQEFVESASRTFMEVGLLLVRLGFFVIIKNIKSHYFRNHSRTGR